jgi:thimet oligopeptidase
MDSIPSFEASESDHLKRAQAAIEEALAVQGKRTVENTLAPFDRAYDELQEAEEFANLVQNVHPDKAFRDNATAMVAKVSSRQSAMALNPELYQALRSMDVSAADEATKYYVQRQLLEFRLAGVDQDEVTRARLNVLQDRLSKAQSQFERNIADGNRTVEVHDSSELEGLPEDFIASHKPDATGVIHLTTRYPDSSPVMTYAKSDALRKRMQEANGNKAYPENDPVLHEMMTTRYEIARLVGYPTWSELNAQDKMMGSGRAIAAFITDLDKTVRPAEMREVAMELAEEKKTDPGATQIQQHQQQYLMELVRRSQYNFDSASVRVYLPYEEVKQGLLATAAKLFQLEFRQEKDAPAWDPSVETWDVLEGGRAIGRFYLDMHPRAGKYNHNATFTTVTGIAGRRLPEGVLICNFPGPTASDSGLMQYENAVTFFHEFGHLIHHIVAGKQRWAGVSGISAEPDFNEAPSQMLEEWMANPDVLASFAKHYKTGEPIPAELVKRMNRASAFARASYVAVQNATAALSYDLYNSDPSTFDPYALALQERQRYTMAVPSKGSHGIASLNHLAGYSSMYYTYMWDKVIAEDLYAQFNKTDPFAGGTPMRYRRQVLEPGGSKSANETVREFLGRPVNMAAFKRWLGQEFIDEPTTSAPPIPNDASH